MRNGIQWTGAWLLAGMLLAVWACSPPTSSHKKNATLSGKVIDVQDGHPVSGAKVVFANATATSGASGDYSLDLGKSSGTASGAFSLTASGYQTFFFSPFTLDATDTSLDLTVWPVTYSTAVYPPVEIKGKVYEYQTSSGTPTELDNGWKISVTVLSKINGSYTKSGYVYTKGTGYSTGTNFLKRTNDCLVYIAATPPTSSPTLKGFGVIKTAVDLTGDATVDAYEDLASEKTVTLTASGQLTGTMTVPPYSYYAGMLALTTPYGNLWTNTNMSFTTTNTATQTFTNPANYPVVLWQMKYDYLVNGAILQPFVLAAGATLGSTANFPDIDTTSYATSEALDASSLGYNASTGTLSVNAVAGSRYYRFELWDSATGDFLADLFTDSATTVLSPTVKAVLAGKTVKIDATIYGLDVGLGLKRLRVELGYVQPYKAGFVGPAAEKTSVAF